MPFEPHGLVEQGSGASSVEVLQFFPFLPSGHSQ